MLFCSLSVSSSALAAAHYLPEYTDIWGGFTQNNSIEANTPKTAQICRNAGYSVSSCPAGYALNIKDRCPFEVDSNLYKKCYSYAELCGKDGFTLTCPAGYEPDPANTCHLDSIYTKCKCAACLGYDYNLTSANAPGYLADGDPCLSCNESRYKRKINPCTGFKYDSSNCGVSSCGTLSGDTCQSGEIIKYKECKPCPVPNCPDGKVNYDTYWCESALKCWWPLK